MPRRRPTDPLQDVIGVSSTPLFLVDSDRVIRWLNAGCAELCGRTAAELVGEVCRHAGGVDPTTIAAVTGAFCPPSEVWTGREALVPAYVPHASGVESPRLIRFIPLGGQGGATDRANGDAPSPTQPNAAADNFSRGLPVTAALGVILPWKEAPTAPRGEARPWRAELSAARARIRDRHALPLVVTNSPAMRRVLAQADLARESTGCVLLVGEGGTGKEHFARAIHFGGPARGQWFVPLECGRLAADELDQIIRRLLERHEPLANAGGNLPPPGTVYLADCDELPRELQLAILEAVDVPEAQRPRLRFFAGLRVQPEVAIAENKLHPDFAAWLSPLMISLPPLAARGDDLPLLARHFLEDINRHGERQIEGFDEESLRQLAEYRWPGNLDELALIVREAHAQATGNHVTTSDLPFRFRTRLSAQNDPPPVSIPEFPPLDTLLEAFERRVLCDALEQARQNKTRAAELLGINRPRLYRRMEQLGIEDRDPDNADGAGT
jgi:DNA-binding NtrC family response regulator